MRLNCPYCLSNMFQNKCSLDTDHWTPTIVHRLDTDWTWIMQCTCPCACVDCVPVCNVYNVSNCSTAQHFFFPYCLSNMFQNKYSLTPTIGHGLCTLQRFQLPNLSFFSNSFSYYFWVLPIQVFFFWVKTYKKIT